MSLAADTRLGPYEIVSRLGTGAMGEVYRARDVRLNRDVALKVLPLNGNHDDEERRQRLQQEARAASALNHPNILTVHEFGTLDGISYIATELVDGESLRSLIQRGPLPLKSLLDIGIQIAEGLAAAHHAGILHRDLKPENIMLTPDGRVKLLDFGLAKPIVDAKNFELNETAEHGTGSEYQTEPGVLLGTVAYMSPEQAAGKKLDYTSDQFSLGIILHEMATGQHPFRRDSALETLMATAHATSPPFTPGPVGFRLIVERCLAHNPERRFPETADLARRLRKIRDEMHLAPVTMDVADAGNRLGYFLRRWRKPVGLALLVTVAAAAVWLGAGYLARLRRNAGMDYSPVVTDASATAFPAWAPAGDLLAYAGERNGRFQIFTRKPGSGASTVATHCGTDCLEPFWSPDGSKLYYRSAEEQLWSVGSAGGAPQLLRSNVSRAALSSDGKLLALLERETPGSESRRLWLAPAAGGPPVRIAGGQFGAIRWLDRSFLAFAPGKRRLAVFGLTSRGLTQLWIYDTAKSEARRVPLDSIAAMPAPFTWTNDGHRLVMSSGGHLVAVDPRSGAASPLTTGTGVEQFPSVAADGHRFAFSAGRISRRMMRYSLLGGPGMDVSTSSLGEWSPAWTQGGDRFAYATEHNGQPEVWIRSADGWSRKVLDGAAFGEGKTQALSGVSLSGDGQRVVFTRAGTDGHHIWVAPISGDRPVRAVRAQTAIEESPSWSPDNSTIAFLVLASGGWKLAVAAPGSPDVRFLSGAARVEPAWSPDSRRLAFALPDGSLAVTQPDGFGLRTISGDRWLACAWTQDGRSVAGLRLDAEQHLVLGSVQPDTGLDQTLSDLGFRPPMFVIAEALGRRPLNGAAITPDGSALQVGQIMARPEIWMASVRK